MSTLRTKANHVHVHDLLLNCNSDLHWSLLETFIPKKNLYGRYLYKLIKYYIAALFALILICLFNKKICHYVPLTHFVLYI